ncbi:5-(carboxyamino)imidazole ribonucleotide mutase, partial [Xanthomonas citri pv. citri]|nr:5-(carboxyamino)imidazole ribonucleotide mutase [Xanthomonas citri pv. citri]
MPETTTASRKPRRGEKVKTTTGGARRLACDANGPQVSIIMGSDSDWPTMEPAAQDMIEFGRGAHKRGIKVIIAGAGGAAHLPGMVAALTPLPVIGVPVPLAHLDGMDSLLSIVQMPGGVPVATVGVGNAKNAGLLAVRILAASTPELCE